METKKAVGIKTVFMGTSSFAATILKSLIEEKYNIISAYTQPDKKAGRKQELKKSSVKSVAEEHKIPVFTPDKFDETEIGKLAEQKPDLIIVAAYGRILPRAVLDLPGFGSVNIHPSLLPCYRGPSPVQNAILNGEEKTGTTVMLMDEGMDTGAILAQEEVLIGSDETAPELLDRLAAISSKLLLKTIPLWIRRKVEPKPQDKSKATLCQLIERSDGHVIWANDAKSIYDQFRALTPWPGIFTFWEKDGINLRLKLNKISFEKEKAPEMQLTGQVFEFDGKVSVKTDNGTIILEEVQLEGKNSMKIGDFVNGNVNFVNSVLK